MSTLLEIIRAAHEDIERFERLIVKDLQNKPATKKAGLAQRHRVRYVIDQITSTTHRLVEMYEDKDNERVDEIATGTNLFNAFYDGLKEIREYHKRYPSAQVLDTTDDYKQLLEEEPHIEFSGEEAYGQYLDMHELYNDYINLKSGKQTDYTAYQFINKIDYTTYLEVFSHPQHIPQNLKMTSQYRAYLSKMIEYLVYFLERTEPLQDLDRVFSKLTAIFEEQWANGKVDGWKSEAEENGCVSEQNTSIDLHCYSTIDELVELGPKKLKEALGALGLKSGGTIQQRAERLFLTKHTPLEKLDKKHFRKGARKPKQDGAEIDNSKQIALMEIKIEKLCEILKEKVIRTKQMVVKKQAQTYREIDAEREYEETPDIASDDEDQRISNPLKLPMGWDGKPIPVWLYKLHGLNKEFKCEICGDYSYRGRRDYERHFKEFRHENGMRQLGIPNTKSFYEITSIEGAQQLWKRIQEKQYVNKWKPDSEEEYEDSDGNIYNKKTYADLKRQGLL